MKHVSYFIIIGVLSLISCDTKIPLTPGINDFKVNANSKNYKVGEIVSFNLNGNPDMITFYSGEVFHEYEYRKGRTIQLEDAILSFTTSKPVTARAQEDQFRVVISTDFNGDYSHFSNIESATWTDITDLFTLSTTITFIPSGTVDLSNFVKFGKPFYIAFRYILLPMEFGRAGTWHVQNFSFLSNSTIGPILLGDMISSGFRIIEQNPETALSRSRITSTRITLQGYEQTTDNDIHTETWAISTAFNLEEIDQGPDSPIAIKGVESSKLNTYEYTYTEPGSYKATFVATNGNVDGLNRVIKEVTVNIEP